jgi:hypothetical protein
MPCPAIGVMSTLSVDWLTRTPLAKIRSEIGDQGEAYRHCTCIHSLDVQLQFLEPFFCLVCLVLSCLVCTVTVTVTTPSELGFLG